MVPTHSRSKHIHHKWIKPIQEQSYYSQEARSSYPFPIPWSPLLTSSNNSQSIGKDYNRTNNTIQSKHNSIIISSWSQIPLHKPI